MRWSIRRGRAGLVAGAVVVLVALPSTGAFAYWRSGGGGTTTTVLPVPQTVEFSVGAPTTMLYPGYSAGVVLVAHNPNPFSVRVPSLAPATDPGPAFTVDAGHSGCDLATLSFTEQDDDGDGWVVPGRVGSTDGSLRIVMPAALHMDVAAANACQGASFGVRLRTP